MSGAGRTGIGRSSSTTTVAFASGTSSDLADVDATGAEVGPGAAGANVFLTREKKVGMIPGSGSSSNAVGKVVRAAADGRLELDGRGGGG